jgi:hypothetical protein
MASYIPLENLNVQEKRLYIPLSCNEVYRSSFCQSQPFRSSDPLHHFLQTKRTNLTRSIKTIVNLIEQREMLHEHNLYKIEQSECEIQNKLLQIDHWIIGFNPVIDKRRSALEKELLDFEKQKRQEKVAAWKDVLSLKNQLIDLSRDLYKEQNMKNLL